MGRTCSALTPIWAPLARWRAWPILALVKRQGRGLCATGDRLMLATMTNQSDEGASKARAHLRDWDEIYRKGEIIWDKGAPSPPLRQYLERHAIRGRALVP